MKEIKEIIKYHVISQAFLLKHNADEMDGVMKDIEDLAKAIEKHIDENYVEKKKYDKAMKIIQEDYMKEVKRRNDAIRQTM